MALTAGDSDYIRTHKDLVDRGHRLLDSLAGQVESALGHGDRIEIQIASAGPSGRMHLDELSELGPAVDDTVVGT